VSVASRTLDALTAVLVNYGTPELTLRSARALLDDGVPAGRLVVVDNGSADDSYERFRAELTACRVLRIAQNVGYARAANAGARELPGGHYLFVNNDAFVNRTGTVAELLRCLSDPAVGVVVPRVLNEDSSLQPTVHPIQTPAVALVLATGVGRLLPNRWQPAWGRHWDHRRSQVVPAAASVAMLVRGEVWESLEGFHEGSLLYAEDIDLCWRARNRGWRVWYTTEAEFVHLRSSTTKRDWGEVERSELIARAEAAMIARNLGPLAAALSRAFVAAGLALRWLAFAAAGRRHAAACSRSALRGHLGPASP
jgi:GT2 family glycosyltransferase